MMFLFVRKWFAPRANPIGVDFGTDSLRLAQVRVVGGEHHLVAAASADVPYDIRHDEAGRATFFIETTRDLIAQGNFHGRQAVLALPASSTFVQHLRVPAAFADDLENILPRETQGKLPIDSEDALIRHLVAGEIPGEGSTRLEVILLAASRRRVDQYLAVAGQARLDVVGMNVEPKALVDCFTHIYRRKTDGDITNCIVDIGCASTRVVVARGGDIFFVRSLPIGGDDFSRAVAVRLGVSFEAAKGLRLRLAHASGTIEDGRPRDAIPAAQKSERRHVLAGTVAPQPASATSHMPSISARWSDPDVDPATAGRPTTQADLIADASRDPLMKLIAEMENCRQYCEAAFPLRPIERLIFVGGEARHRPLCQHIAQTMGLAAQIGDPLVRMGRISAIGVQSGIDRRQPQPGWAVAIGLSMGPAEDSLAAVESGEEA